MEDRLFVYGTLRKDSGNPWQAYLERHADYLGAGSFQGKLYDLGSFPGVVASHSGADRVFGDVYRLHYPEETLPRLDEYEGCLGRDALYCRKVATVLLDNGEEVQAWVYLLNHRLLGAEPIEKGDWLEYVKSA